MSSPDPTSTYSVKYLGIVDGSMGILSRKMALQGSQSPTIRQIQTISKNQSPQIPKYDRIRPVLGNKYVRKSYNPDHTTRINDVIQGSYPESHLKSIDKNKSTMGTSQMLQSGYEDGKYGGPTESIGEVKVDIKNQYKTIDNLRMSSTGAQIIEQKNKMVNQGQQKDISGYNSSQVSNLDLIALGEKEKQLQDKFKEYQEMIIQMKEELNARDRQMELENLHQEQKEKHSGFPQPQLYDQHYINKYAYPKGLKCGRKENRNDEKQSLYDMAVPNNRKGFSGWKLTKRTDVNQSVQLDSNVFKSDFQLMSSQLGQTLNSVGSSDSYGTRQKIKVQEHPMFSPKEPLQLPHNIPSTQVASGRITNSETEQQYLKMKVKEQE